MKLTVLKITLMAFFLLALNSYALATINTIRGTLACFNGCSPSVVQNISPNKTFSFEVIGQFVDLSTGVQIDDPAINVSYGARKSGAGSSIIINFVVGSNATIGDHTVKMRYLVETNGPDMFKVHVVNRGTIGQITPTNNIPINQVVQLTVTGTKLSRAQVAPSNAYRNAHILAGATDSRATVELEFTQSGTGVLQLFDANLTSNDLASSGIAQFVYSGSPSLQFGNVLVSSTGVIPQVPIGGGTIAPIPFNDVAPRANMLNIFRRLNTTPTFTENGTQFFAVDNQNCAGMTGNQSQVITIPDLTWGVSNVGTADINIAVTSQLKTGTQVLQTQTVPGLNPGETRNFTFTRQNSRVRVSTFLLHQGCFVSPTSDFFFEDPTFTVLVNTNGAVVEAIANQANNSRNY